jgi:hypothetical protein
MASHQKKASYQAGETKARTEVRMHLRRSRGFSFAWNQSRILKNLWVQEKAGHAMDATKDKAQQAKDHAAGTGHGTEEVTRQKASETGSYLGQKTDQAKHKAGETTESTKQKAGETTEAAKQKAGETTEAAKQKASEASQYAKDSAVAGKDETGNVIQQVGWFIALSLFEWKKNTEHSASWNSPAMDDAKAPWFRFLS